MMPLRREDITLFCEDAPQGRSPRLIGRSQRLLESAVQELRKILPFVLSVVPTGVSSKNDVQVRAKFAREDGYRAFGVRDRDFLPRAQVDEYQEQAFHENAAHIRPWPLPRYCIESYLLDEDVLGAVIPTVDADALRAAVDEAAVARRWLDVARGTLDDLAWRLRHERESIKSKPSDRESAMCEVRKATELLRQRFVTVSADDRLVEKLDALSADMQSDGPLRHRVDGRELVRDLERTLSVTHAGSLPPGGLLGALDKRAHEQPPAALLVDLRAVLEAIPLTWRSVDV